MVITNRTKRKCSSLYCIFRVGWKETTTWTSFNHLKIRFPFLGFFLRMCRYNFFSRTCCLAKWTQRIIALIRIFSCTKGKRMPSDSLHRIPWIIFNQSHVFFKNFLHLDEKFFLKKKEVRTYWLDMKYALFFRYNVWKTTATYSVKPCIECRSSFWLKIQVRSGFREVEVEN